MSGLSEGTRALYGQTLIEMTNDEVLHEQLVRTNAMLEANVQLYNAKQQPTSDTVLEQLQQDAVEAMEYLGMVRSEIEDRRAQSAPAEEMQVAHREAYGQMLKQAQQAALDDLLDKSKSLTDMVTTMRSMMLLLAGELPTEGEYDPETWSYPGVIDTAQSAAQVLVDAWTASQEVQQKLQHAARYIQRVRADWMTLQAGETPEPIDTEDGIPF